MATKAIILLGHPGAGKSTICRSLTTLELFKSSNGMASCTQRIQHGFIDDTKSGRRLLVVDTPGFEGYDQAAQHLANVLDKVKTLDANAEIVILFCHQAQRFGDQDAAIFRRLLDEFGQDVINRVILNLTQADVKGLMSSSSRADFLRTATPAVAAIVSRINHRVLFTAFPPLDDLEMKNLNEKRIDESRTELIQTVVQLPQIGSQPSSQHARRVWAAEAQRKQDAARAEQERIQRVAREEADRRAAELQRQLEAERAKQAAAEARHQAELQQKQRELAAAQAQRQSQKIDYWRHPGKGVERAVRSIFKW